MHHWCKSPTTLQRCSAGLRSRDCWGHLSIVNTCHVQDMGHFQYAREVVKEGLNGGVLVSSKLVTNVTVEGWSAEKQASQRWQWQGIRTPPIYSNGNQTLGETRLSWWTSLPVAKWIRGRAAVQNVPRNITLSIISPEAIWNIYKRQDGSMILCCLHQKPTPNIQKLRPTRSGNLLPILFVISSQTDYSWKP